MVCTVAEVRSALNAQNVELPSGKLTGNNTELTVKTIGNLSKANEFNNIIIRTDGDKIVHFSDIGRAELGPENLETQLAQSGLPMIGLAIRTIPGANYLDISKEFYKKYEALRRIYPKTLS